jgi:hypothetical protein
MSGQQTTKPGRTGLPPFLSRRRGVGFLSLVVLVCLGISWFPWTSANASRPAAAVELTLNPTSGPAGTSISASLVFAGFRAGYAGLTASITFDSTSVGSVTVAQCPSATLDVGFGTLCTGQAVTIQAPQNATPGPHTVTAMIPASRTTNEPAVSFTATFTVTASQVPPSLILSPTSGAAGSLDSVSLIGLLDVAFSQTAALTFDGASIGSQAIVACSNNLQGAGGSGFGAACTGNAFNAQIPVNAQPGSHTVTATISSPPGIAAIPNITVSATFTVVQTTPPSLILNPTSGLAGSTTSVSLINLPADTMQLNAVITFDSTPIDQQVIVSCTAAGGAGFGIACNGNAVNELIPVDAQAGPHTVTATITYPTNTQLPPITVTASYSVAAPDATATATATVTATALPGATVIPATNTPVSIAKATATATATATPAPRPILMLVRSDFDSGAVLVSLRGPANAKVRLDLQIKQGGAAKFSLTRQGVTNKAGLYGTSLHVTLASRKPGTASITVAITQGGKVTKAVRRLRYP